MYKEARVWQRGGIPGGAGSRDGGRAEEDARAAQGELTPSTFAAFFTSRGFTHRIAPYRPIPAHTASAAVTLIFAPASFSQIPATAPGRSSPLIRKTFLGPVSLIFAAFAAARNGAGCSGTRSIWARRAAGKPEYASRLTPASRRAFNTRRPSPGLSGTVV